MVMKLLRKVQKNEITEHFIYLNLAKKEKKEENKKILEEIAREEVKHYYFWKKYSGENVSPDRFRIFFYSLLSRLLGITFTLKIMEGGEKSAQKTYSILKEKFPEAEEFLKEEQFHEDKLIKMIDEEMLKYTGSFVLGMNDALVELTGALAGFTLAFKHPGTIAAAGLIAGIAASLSMSASEYISTKTEMSGRNPFKASLYTGIAYILTVFILILPFLLFSNVYLCLGIALLTGILVVFFFTFYTTVTHNFPFLRRFIEMTIITFSVSLFSFGIGLVVRKIFGIEI